MKIEQGYDKKMYYKLTLNRLKLMKNFTSINLLIGHLVQGSFLKTSNLDVTHVYPCGNYELIKVN
jgi:hypothetical protein